MAFITLTIYEVAFDKFLASLGGWVNGGGGGGNRWSKNKYYYDSRLYTKETIQLFLEIIVSGKIITICHLTTDRLKYCLAVKNARSA